MATISPRLAPKPSPKISVLALTASTEHLDMSTAAGSASAKASSTASGVVWPMRYGTPRADRREPG